MKKLMCFFFLFFATELALAGESEKTVLIHQLEEIKTFMSDFNQVVVDEHGRVLQHASGKMQFVRPSLFYWHTLSPDSQTIWYRNNQVIIFDPELEQATIKKNDSKDDPSMLPVMLLTGDAAQALKNFVVEWRQDKYILTPKSTSENTLLLRVVLEFDAKGAMKEIKYQTTLGQMTDVTFSQVKVNQRFDKTLFYQALPKDTDIVNAN